MPLQLTPEQEIRIRTVVDTGAHRSTEEAIAAAVSAVEIAAVPGFDGSSQELEELLLEGLNSGTAIVADADYWNRLRAGTDAIAAEHQAGTKHW